MEGNEIKIEWVPVGATGRVRLVVSWPGGEFTDTFNVTSHKRRRQFLNDLIERYPTVIVAEVDRELERLASTVASRTDEPKHGEAEAGGKEEGSGSAAQMLISLGRDRRTVELFHSGSTSDGETFARIAVDDHFEAWPVRSSAYAAWLRQRYYTVAKGAPAAQAFTDAINTLDAIARFEGNSVAVHLRFAPFEEKIVIDLCDDSWSVVVVDRTGWNIVPSSQSPVRFMRKRGMEPLPRPIKGGSIHELRPFLNIESDEAWCLYTCSIVTLLLPDGPYAHLGFTGEQGSAKSTAVDRTRAITDPTSTARRKLPRDVRDLMIAAENARVLSFDNLSHISPEISDALCMLSTGGGMSVRGLYTDREETIFSAKRPVILNGIEDVTTRSDLLDRSVIFNLPAISERARREEAEMNAAFAAAAPRIFGALLDALSGALAKYPTVVLTAKPRMADFARWATAAEQAMGWPTGSFMTAYMRNRSEAYSVTIESSPIGRPILKMIPAKVTWKGTAQELLACLNEHYTDEFTRKGKDWPRSPRALSGALRRIAPALRASGFVVELGERESNRDRDRLIRLAARQKTAGSEAAADGVDGVDGGCATQDTGDKNGSDGQTVDSPFAFGSEEAKQPSRPSTPSEHEDVERADGDREAGTGGAESEADADGEGEWKL